MNARRQEGRQASEQILRQDEEHVIKTPTARTRKAEPLRYSSVVHTQLL